MKLADLQGKKLGACVSGGLDSRAITRKLVDLGVDVTCFTADLAQPDESDIGDVIHKMAPCGAETVIVDLKAEMANACFTMIKAQAMYDGGYWNSTGIARAVTVRGLLPAMQKRGCSVLAHGATGRGNDQMRFERYTNVLSPEMDVFSPWRDPQLLEEFPGRLQMVEYLSAAGIEAFVGGSKRYSTDANLAGLSYEAEDLESLDAPASIVEPQMGVWPSDAPDTAESVTVVFENGQAVAVNDTGGSPLEIMLKVNEIGGRHGVGMKNALENRIIGTKSRGVYEAPGMELLGRGLLHVYEAVLDRRATALFRQLSAVVADQVYDGRFFDPATTAALQGIDALAEMATGTITLELYKGNLSFVRLTACPQSIYNAADSSMEESAGLNPASSQGYAEIQSVEALALARAGQIRR